MEYFYLVINFIFEHWMVFIPCLFGLVEFVLLLIFKKRPQITDNSITEFILFWCHEAEQQFGHGHGEEKKELVLSKCKEKFGKIYLILVPFIYKTIGSILECQSK